jgi:hypothetical protein
MAAAAQRLDRAEATARADTSAQVTTCYLGSQQARREPRGRRDEAPVAPGTEGRLGHDFSRVPIVESGPVELRRQPAPEPPDIRERRLEAAAGARSALDRIRLALSRGLLWAPDTETPAGDGVDHPFVGLHESWADRQERLRQVVFDMAELASELQRSTLTAERLKPDFEAGGSNWSVVRGAAQQAERDLHVLYIHWQIDRGADIQLVFENLAYIDADPLPTPQAPRAATRPGVALQVYLHVPDPKNAPLRYHVLTGHEGWQEHGIVVQVWSDEFGEYYNASGDRRIYLPEKP